VTDITGQDWEEQASNWIAWSRKPDFDSYWRYRDEFFTLVPPPGTATVDMDVADLPGSIHEAARILTPGGRLCIAITHPIVNTGTMVDGNFVLDQPYFKTRRFTNLVEQDGMTMLFQGWSHPLTGFTRPLEDAGLLIEAIREPKAISAKGKVWPYPFHFWLRAMRPR
jgi:hypothetical protein